MNSSISQLDSSTTEAATRRVGDRTAAQSSTADVSTSPVKAVTFDVNGTLIHSPRMGEIYADVLRRHGIAVAGSEILAVIRDVWQEFSCQQRLGEDRFSTHPEGSRGWWFRFIDRVGEHLGDARPSRFAKTELFERFAQADAWVIYEEVQEVLTALRNRGLRLAVLSNWDDRLPLLLERLELAPYFEAVVYSAAVGVEKPFPAIFQAALDRLDAAPEEVVHVGDRPQEDIEGAEAVGMRALHLARGGSGDLRDLRPLPELL